MGMLLAMTMMEQEQAKKAKPVPEVEKPVEQTEKPVESVKEPVKRGRRKTTK